MPIRVDFIVMVRIPVLIHLFRIHADEKIRDQDLFRTAVHTVAAFCTRNQLFAPDDLTYLLYRLCLFLVKRPEVFHKVQIFLHLVDRAHSGEDHHDPRESRRIADRICRRTSAMELVKYCFCIIRKICETAAADRFHDDHRFSMLSADFIAFSGLNRRVIIVDIVELELYHLYLRILGEDLVKNLRTVMERDSKMADLSLFLEFQCRLIRMTFLELFKLFNILGMHQIKVKILHSAAFQLGLKKRADILFFFEEISCQLIRENIAFSRVTARQAVFDRKLALSADIAARRVKVIESLFQEIIDHLTDLFLVHLFPDHRETHTAKSKIFLDLIHPLLLFPRDSPDGI